MIRMLLAIISTAPRGAVNSKNIYIRNGISELDLPSKNVPHCFALVHFSGMVRIELSGMRLKKNSLNSPDNRMND